MGSKNKYKSVSNKERIRRLKISIEGMQQQGGYRVVISNYKSQLKQLQEIENE